ncbi:MAG: FMN-binding glutamate synthase family protein [Bacteroidota bacterium]
MKARPAFFLISFLVIATTVAVSVWVTPVWGLFLLIGPLFVIGVSDVLQKKQAIRRNFPIIGHGRYLLENIRPEIMQYFVETDTEGRPINRIFRSLIYQRAKSVNDTTPFGTQMDVYNTGYEWMEHSMYPKTFEEMDHDPRVVIGGPDCQQPYSSSVLNISAMSFGSLSKNAVLALNGGAKDGRFAHNTGEGGISTYHLEPGGDLIWQVGTGYFGCRDLEGRFDPELFAKNATRPEVKMVEVKLSQGAKPGHGGILPAGKNTPEIAAIRNVQVGTTVASPPYHTAFTNPMEMMSFIQELRKLSGGKPIGFKLCVGNRREFVEVCEAMLATGIKPDFITVDGAEGGTGAAPVEFSNSLGMPLRDGLAFVHDTLKGFDLRKDVKLLAAGKIISAFHMIRAIALGADVCYSARAMMMAVGCIQALQCHSNTCPTGVATQDAVLMKGLDPANKRERVANFHQNTLDAFVEMLAAAGLANSQEIRRKHILRRVTMQEVLSYAELYPVVDTGALLEKRAESLKA